MKRAWILSLLVAIASATGANAAEGAFDVHLTEPAEQAELVAGSKVSIAWESTNLPADVEEWEAFLSINGGRTYPIRLTPHLDATIRRFTWTVPSLPGTEASILLRFGDEQEERPFVFPARARIRGAVQVLSFKDQTNRETLSLGDQEKDDHGEKLVEWVEGSRDGSHLQQVSAREPILSDGHELSVPQDHESASAVSNRLKRLDPRALHSLENQPILGQTPQLNALFLECHPTGILILTGRLNI